MVYMSINMSRKYTNSTEKEEYKLLKASITIGIITFCRNIPLLDAIRIYTIGLSRDVAQIYLIPSFLKGTSRIIRYVYLHVLNMIVSSEMKGHVDLLTNANSICVHRDEKYARQHRFKMKNSYML